MSDPVPAASLASWLPPGYCRARRDPPRVSRDPKDDKFLATARVGQAGCLISEDNDLLDLGEYEGTLILSVAAFLFLLEADEQDLPS